MVGKPSYVIPRIWCLVGYQQRAKLGTLDHFYKLQLKVEPRTGFESDFDFALSLLSPSCSERESQTLQNRQTFHFHLSVGIDLGADIRAL